MQRKQYVQLALLLLLMSESSMAHAMLGMVTDALVGLGTLLMKFATALFIIIATLLFVGQYILTQIMVKIAVILMPLMVPFIVLEKTRFLFEGWLKFVITAGFIKIVGALLYGILLGNVEYGVTLAHQVSEQADGAPVVFTVYSTLLLLTGITAYIMMQTQQIGNGLVSGFVQGGFRFSPVQTASNVTRGGAAAAGAAGRLANSAAGAAHGASTASSGARMAGAMTGAQAGFTGQMNKAAAAAAKATSSAGSTAGTVSAPSAPSPARSPVQRPGSGANARRG